MADWFEHGPGVYTIHYDSLSLNVGAVDCGDALVVIDTRCHPHQARELTADLARLSRLPVGAVINTHHHWDHTFGNCEFAPLPIWGHERCAARLRHDGLLTRDRLSVAHPDQADRFAEVRVVPPDRTFTDHATLECGPRRIGMHHLGLGHTDKDVVVVVDDGVVVFAGELIEEGAPPAYDDAFPLEWPATAGRLLDLAAGAVIPGHGAVVDRAFAAAQAEEIAEVARLAAECHAEGMPPTDAARAGGPFGPATLVVAFRRAWEHLDRGDPAPPP